MKYAKMFRLLAVAAAALMAFAATASADSATSPTGTTYTSTITASSEGHIVLHNPIAKIECASSISGSITGHGAGKPVTGPFSSVTFTGCTDSWHVTVVSPGSFAIENNSGGYNGLIRVSGLTFEATRFGLTCRYNLNSTTIGTLTGGTPATIHVTASVPFHSGAVFCGEGATAWTGSYKVNTPTSLFIDNN